MAWLSLIAFGAAAWTAQIRVVKKEAEDRHFSKSYYRNLASKTDRINRYRQDFYQRALAVNTPDEEIMRQWLPVIEALAEANVAASKRSFMQAGQSLQKAMRHAEHVFFEMDRLHLLQVLSAPRSRNRERR
jgi:hypothetical protein